MEKIKCKNRNKAARFYTNEDIDKFLKSIKYFDTIKLDRPCIFSICFNKKDKNGNYLERSFDSLYDAIRTILEYKNAIIDRENYIAIYIKFTDNKNCNFSDFAGRNFFEVKDMVIATAKSAYIELDPDMTQVYIIDYYDDEELCGRSIGWDMKYLYNKENCIIPEPYTAYNTTKSYLNKITRYGWKKKKYDVHIPWFIEKIESIDNDTHTVAKWGGYFYGFIGSFQATNGDGYVDTDDSYQPNAMALATISLKDADRPHIDGITRYKFIVEFPDGRQYPYYVECETGNIAKAIDLLTGYDWAYPEINKRPNDFIKSIEAVPTGEWF